MVNSIKSQDIQISDDIKTFELFLKKDALALDCQVVLEKLLTLNDIFFVSLKPLQVYVASLEKLGVSAAEIVSFWSALYGRFPDNSNILKELAKWLIRSRAVDQVKSILDEKLAFLSKSYDFMLARAEILANLKEVELSDKAFKSLIQDHPKQDLAKVLYAKNLKSRGLLFEAWDELQKLHDPMALGAAHKTFLLEIKSSVETISALEGGVHKDGNSNVLSLKYALLHFQNRVCRERAKGELGRVALITGSLGPGGAERQLSRTAAELDRYRKTCGEIGGVAISHPIEVIVKTHGVEKDSNFFLPVLKNEDVSVFELIKMEITPVSKLGIDSPELINLLNALPSSALYGVQRLVSHFRKSSTDVAFIWQDGAVIFAALAALIAGVPKIVLNIRGLPPSLRTHLLRPEYEPMYRALSKVPGVSFVSNSKAAAVAYADWLDIPVERFEVVYNGVPKMPTIDSVDEGKIWDDFAERTKNATSTVGGVFRFDTDKRPILVIQYVREYLNINPDARFVFVGYGRLFDKCVDIAKKLKVSDRILFVGKSSNVGYWISKMEALILMSRFEGLPNVLIEAQHLGVPVVSTPAGGAIECFQNGKTGFILSSVEEPDLVEAAHKTEEFIQRFRENKELSLESMSYAENNFSIPKMIEKTVRTLSS